MFATGSPPPSPSASAAKPASCEMELGPLVVWLWMLAAALAKRGGGEVPQPPPGHGERFGEPVHDERAFAHARERGEAHVLRRRVDDVLVNLVREHEQTRVVRHHLGDGAERLLGIHRAGWIRRAAENQKPRVGGEGGAELLGGEDEALVRGGGHDDGLGAGEAAHLGIRHPVRRGDEHLVADRDVAITPPAPRIRFAAAEDDLVRGVRDAVLRSSLSQTAARREAVPVFGE